MVEYCQLTLNYFLLILGVLTLCKVSWADLLHLSSFSEICFFNVLSWIFLGHLVLVFSVLGRGPELERPIASHSPCLGDFHMLYLKGFIL